MFQKEILTAQAPAPIGPYSQAVKLSDFVYISGQLGIDPLTNEFAGGDIKSQTHQALQNVLAILQAMGLNFEHVVKTTVFMKDLNDFSDFNTIYGEYFDKPYPARSCVQVAALPKGGLVEIECLVIDTLAYEQTDCCGCQQQDCECQDGCDCSKHQ